MEELVDALRHRRDELNISHETIDQIAGYQSGYTSKLLAPRPIKNLGPMSFGSLLGALGIAVMVVPDPAACARVSKHWQPRKRPQRLAPLSILPSMALEIQITPELSGLMSMSERGKNGAKSRNKKMKKRARQRAATHAARMRWAKQK